MTFIVGCTENMKVLLFFSIEGYNYLYYIFFNSLEQLLYAIKKPQNSYIVVFS